MPLSDQALHILREVRRRWPNSPYVFPGRYLRKPRSNATLERLMQRLPRDEVPHGLRSSFRDGCRDNRKDRDLAEAALSHAVRDKTEAAYARSDLLDARRTLMQQWGDFCCGAEELAAEGRRNTDAPLAPTRRHHAGSPTSPLDAIMRRPSVDRGQKDDPGGGRRSDCALIVHGRGDTGSTLNLLDADAKQPRSPDNTQCDL